MLAEILLVPGSVSAIFDKVFPLFDQEKNRMPGFGRSSDWNCDGET